MREVMISTLQQFIRQHQLSPFHTIKTPMKTREESLFKTKDAKAVQTRVLNALSRKMHFADSSALFAFFPPTIEREEILRRQTFIQEFPKLGTEWLKEIVKPRPFWKAPYGVVVVTEDETTFSSLQKLGCPVQFLVSEQDVASLEDYDLVQVIECEQYQRILERLPQSVFFDTVDDVFLERYVELLSGWKHNIEALRAVEWAPMQTLVQSVVPLLSLLDARQYAPLTRERIDEALETMNDALSVHVKQLTFSGASLVQMLSQRALPPELQGAVKKIIVDSGLPSHLFTQTFPIVLEDGEVARLLKKQHAEHHSKIAEDIARHAKSLRTLPEQLDRLAELLLIVDFMSGISKMLSPSATYPLSAERFALDTSENALLDTPKPISFHLDTTYRCSILTGANSGGKTTLLEHLLQAIVFFQLGLPVSGKAEIPLFSEIYYFAKNKGSTNKGAFETLLHAMAQITPGPQTLILADEIEAVTEPGVAGIIVCASAEYFLNKGCFLVIATHLGKEIQTRLPQGARIDGIEAKGLDENFDLIVDHNPVLGRLAHSTPELIVEKLASIGQEAYFTYVFEYLKKGM